MGEVRDMIKMLKTPIILTASILIAVSLLYFMIGPGSAKAETMQKADLSIYEGIQLKAAYTDKGDLKIFALAKNNNLQRYTVEEGEKLPETDSIILGFEEADMMKKEGLIQGPGDELKGLFGIDTKIGGILQMTNTPIDYFHFTSEKQFEKIDGNERTLFIKMTRDGVPKIFMTYEPKDNETIEFKLAEGSIDEYESHTIGKTTYHPLILGAKEAELMREEKLFERTGDLIKGFFGTNVVVVGIAEKTGSSADIMHFIPLEKTNFG